MASSVMYQVHDVLFLLDDCAHEQVIDDINGRSETKALLFKEELIFGMTDQTLNDCVSFHIAGPQLRNES